MKANCTFRSATVEKYLCPFGFTTFRRSLAWRTRKFSPRPRRWALPPPKFRPVRSIKSAPNGWKRNCSKTHPEIAARLAPKPVDGTAQARAGRGKNRSHHRAAARTRTGIAETKAEPAVVETKIENGAIRYAAGGRSAKNSSRPPRRRNRPGRKVGDKVGFIQLSAAPATARHAKDRARPNRRRRVPADRRNAAISAASRASNFSAVATAAKSASRASRPNPPRRRSQNLSRPTTGEVIIIKPPIVVRELADAAEAKAVQDHRRFDGTGRFRHGQPGD